MKLKQLLVCASLMTIGFGAQAAEPTFESVKDILTKNACLACHAVDKKVVGPAYQEVAEKRKGDPANAELLAQHIRQGSKDVYGPMPMPPNPGISDDDIKQVVAWIMAGAPQ